MGDPIGVAFSPDGKVAYITNDLTNTTSVIDTESETVVNTIGVDLFPTALAFMPQTFGPVHGICSKSEFFTEIELFNIVSWPDVPGVANFIIYRDENLSIVAGKTTSTRFIDHYRQPDTVENYYITFINAAGEEILLGQTSINCVL